MLIPDRIDLDFELSTSKAELASRAEDKVINESMQFHAICPDSKSQILNNAFVAVQHVKGCQVCKELIVLQRVAALRLHH